MQCRVPDCQSAAHGYSSFCQSHKQALRRHGAPTQEGVTVHELRPYLTLVDARKAKNLENETWVILVARWQAVQDHARATLQRFSEGHPGHRADLLAAHHILNVGHSVEAWAVIKTALAMFIMQDQRPTRFKTDAAFDFQLVRRVRGLAESSVGSYWDQKEQRSKKVYRDIPPRVMQAMAQPLKVAFGAPGMALAAKEREDMQKANNERNRLANVLEGLQ